MRQEIDYGQFRYNALSLLWEDLNDKDAFFLDDEDMLDLNIQTFSQLIEEKRKLDIYPWLKEVPRRRETSIYRQQIMEDFVHNPDLFQILFTYGEEAHKLMSMGKFAFEKEATLYNLIKRMEEVETIRQMVEQVLKTMVKVPLASDGLTRYKELLEEIVESPIYEAFIKDIQEIRKLDPGVKSIKIGLNLDKHLQPIEAILLEISDEEFKYTRFMKKMGYYVLKGVKELKMIPRKIFARETVLPPDALNTLEKTIEPATLQLIKFCDQFNMKILEVLSVLYHEMPFYQIGLDLYYKIKEQGEPMIQPIWEEPYLLENIYHINLGIDHIEKVVKNTFTPNPRKPIIILTGANRGGKTTITQSIAIALWFGQLGFYVPGSNMRLPYVQNILVHFPREEKETLDLGRLGEECQRFRTLYNNSNKQSFYFMNEAFSGTSHHESLQIASETLKAIHHKGGMVLFNTHLHELVEELEKDIDPECMMSLVAGKDMKKSPYLIEEGRPLGKSYANEIAKQYGMTYDQLVR